MNKVRGHSAWRRCATSLFFAAALLAGASARAQHLGVSAELSLNQTIFMVDEDMAVKVHVTNRSGQPLALGEGDDWLTVSIHGADNFSAPTLGRMPMAGPFTLPSGMVATRPFNPTPYFDVRRPGRYTINATVQIPQWNTAIECKPVSFTVVEGVPLAGLGALEFGMAADPGVTNEAPQTRRYGLIKVSYQDQLKLYFRLTDSDGRSLRCYPVGRLLSFSVPEAQMDRFNNLHLLWQDGAKNFTYLVFTSSGDILLRQTHVYTDTRPRLKANENGNIAVVGGVRLYSSQDIPSATGESARQ